MLIAIKYSAAWTIMIAALTWPLAITANVLIEWGLSTPIAMLLGFAASTVSWVGAAFGFSVMEEKTGFRLLPRQNDEICFYGVLVALALCFGGSYLVASVANGLFGR